MLPEETAVDIFVAENFRNLPTILARNKRAALKTLEHEFL